MIREYWRTSSIIVALVVILAVLIYIPPNGNNPVHHKNNFAIQLSPPANGTCYLSVGLMHNASSKDIGQDVGNKIDDFSSMVGKNQSVYFDVWGDLWESKEAFWQLDSYEPLLEQGKIKAIGINIWPSVRADSAHDNYTVKKIASGDQDDFIIEQAMKVKDFGYPVFIRFGAEFNIYQGQTYVGQPQSGTFIFGENPSNFIDAWRHYVTVFREQNVTNAIFVWSPNFADFGSHHYSEYYPGDEYVDWVGIDLYQYEPRSDPASMIRGVYNDYSSRKPIAIAEWGANWINQNYSDADRAIFVDKFFRAVNSMPQIKLVNYWYYQDFKFDPAGQPSTTATYAQRISDPRYIG
ncbi:MAG: glycosyl hydrolase [Methanomassiliicoccus sp.]|nr:glycosyl hydrolase [Methanomassiliicoccus sp.]